jgi:putative membrane protein
MAEILGSLYLWVKALHVVAVISWMAGMFYLPRLFVYHVERGAVGSELDDVFQVMERKLLKLIMTPAMVVAWICGLILIAMGGMDFAAVWSWLKIGAVIGMTITHFWLDKRRQEFTQGANTRTGRTYRLVNEVPTVLMLIIVVMVIVRPF